jgi:hypothetical protein
MSVIIEPGYWLDHGVQINHLPTGRGFDEGQPPGQALCPALDALLKWAALREEMADGVAIANKE